MNKILYIHNSDPDSAAANLTQVISMCNAFCRQGNAVTLLLPISKTSGCTDDVRHRLEEKFHLEPGVKLVTFPNLFSNAKVNKNTNFLTLYPVLRKYNPDLVYVRKVHYLAMALLAGKKTVFEVHNDRLHHGSALHDAALRKILIFCSSRKRFLAFIAISGALKRFWSGKGIPEKKILALHDGFDPGAYASLPDSETARKTLGFPTDKKLIVYTGNIYPNRGIHYIIEVSACFPECQFIIAGGPDSMIGLYENSIKDRNIKNILFTGQVPHKNVPIYQAAADVLLAVWSKDVPTINYCSPLKIFEYMASGRPVLAFGYPTIREVMEDGITGFICSPDDVRSMRETLETILARPEESENTAKRAKEAAIQHYSWDNRVKSIIKTLN